MSNSVSQWDTQTTPPTNPVRSPSSWDTVGGFVIEDENTLVGSNKWIQVLGGRPGRKVWTFVNTGANACQIANGPRPAGEPGVTVAAGGTWSEETEDELWAWSNGGTTCDVSETYTPLYDVIQSSGDNGAGGGTIPYIAPLLPGGSTPID